ncbi:MAG: stage III sporulation protein AB [Clostridia bacterium]|nr:stage III sporulation protein AB [Clostridia bacterium]
MKIAGVLLIFVCCTAGGYVLSFREKDKLTECEAFLRLFMYVKNQIGFFLAPTKSIFEEFEDGVLEENGFLPILREKQDGAYQSNWDRALDNCRFCGDGETKNIIRGFGDSIGKSNRDMQIASFDYGIMLLGEKAGKIRASLPKITRMYRAMGFALGAAAAILLL